MEDLLQYCIRELAFDGELGCNVTRLRHFIDGFYKSQRPPVIQNVDDSFCAFVWGLLAEHPTVTVGLVPQGNSAEVYIAPQPSKQKAGNKSKKGAAAAPQDDPEHGSNRLDLLPDAAARSLISLIDEYGANLRVAVSSESCFRAITGGHIRPAKVSPLVYTALQLVSRSRDAGLSVVDLGKKTGYDQKTCFYLVKQLLNLDLIVKLPQRGSGGGNLCIHKYFYEGSEFWQKIRNEEKLAHPDESGTNMTGADVMTFDAIDTRHLANPNFIKSRIITLLKNSENGLHPYYNLILALGISRPTKRDRRNFVSRVRELIRAGIIEKVSVTNSQGASRSILCIRLVQDSRNPQYVDVIVQPGDLEDDEHEESAANKDEHEMSTSPLTDMTIHRQILRLLEEAGGAGLTLNDLSLRLGMFDKRTLEMLLSRMKQSPPPPHLADLAVCEFMENVARVRQHRYFTLSGYLDFARQENIDDASINARFGSIDRSQSGAFLDYSAMSFYKDEAELIAYEDSYRDTAHPPKDGQSRKIGRPRKEDSKPKKTLKSSSKQKARDNSSLSEAADKKQTRGTKRKRKDEETGAKEVSKSRTKRRKTDTLELETQTPENQEIGKTSTGEVGASGSSTTMTMVVQEAQEEEAHIPVNPPIDSDTSRMLPIPGPIPLDPNGGSAEMEIDDTSSQVTSSHQQLKRSDVTAKESLDAEGPPHKRRKSGGPKRIDESVNISQMRAENEIIQVVKECGGIVNTSSKTFQDAYAKVVSSMTAAGQPTSIPMGSQQDRRTLRKIFDRMIERGKLKTMTVTVVPRRVQPRIAKVIYDPLLSQPQIDAFLTSLKEFHVYTLPAPKKLDSAAALTHLTRTKIRESNEDARYASGDLMEREAWCRDITSFGENDEIMRQRFLSERQTVAQMYGYLLGTARRAKELHLFTLSQLQENIESTNVVSYSQRIIAFPYYFQELSVSTYFAIVSNMIYNPELSSLMATDEGRTMRVKDLPQSLYEQLQIGRARARSRIIDLLEVLASLNLVIPLQPSDGSTAYLSCEPNGSYPVCFDRAPHPHGKNSYATLPVYWKFNEVAPIFIFAQRGVWPPPFHRDMMVRTADESLEFWKELAWACTNKDDTLPFGSSDSITGRCICSHRVANGLRRSRAWVSDYILSWSQKQYLTQQWVNPATGYTPLSEPDGGLSILQRICNVIYAPPQVVHDFFVNMRKTFKQAMDRIHWINEGKSQINAEIEAARDKALLARKAAKSRAQIEEDWDALVSRVFPNAFPYGSVGKMRVLRTRYMQSRASMSVQEWEAAVIEVLTSSRSGKRNPTLPFVPRRRNFPTATALLQPVASRKQKSVEEIVQEVKDKAPANESTQMGVGNSKRRPRFNWSVEFDELVRDASVIIRARCRTSRIDWGAFDQLFPTLTRNTVRQRLTTLRLEGGAESYLRALEDKWYELWLQYRGTPALPDDKPKHPSDFDIITHVEFLRKYIDKQALRVGLSTTSSHLAQEAVLLEDVHEFLSNWSVEEFLPVSDKTDIIWSMAGDDHRERSLLANTFSLSKGTGSVSGIDDDCKIGVAESALKMVLSTRDEDYDAENACVLLDGIGEAVVRKASEDLQRRGIISETSNNRRKKPGRLLRISDMNEDALGGIFHEETLVEACTVEDYADQDIEEYRDWNLLATNGDMAAFVDLVSEGRLDFKIDLSEHIGHREELDWNSKKVDDDRIEIALQTLCRARKPSSESEFEGSGKSPMLPLAQLYEPEEEANHGSNAGELATCQKNSSCKGIMTCSACIEMMSENTLKFLEPDKRSLCIQVLVALKTAGPDGLRYDDERISSLDASSTIHYINTSPQPLSFWVGYSQPRLVAREHIRPWLIKIPGNDLHFVFPRRWLNIKGDRMHMVWNAGLRSVVALILTRPGITQLEIRNRLRNVYDRQEVNDLLDNLVEEQIVTRKTDSDHRYLLAKNLRGVGSDEEMHIYFILNRYAWYRVVQA